MSNLNAQLQQLAENYNEDHTQFLTQMAQNKANEQLQNLNDVISSATGIENAGQLIGGSIMALKGVGGSVLKGKEVYDKWKAKTSDNAGDISKNVENASKEGTELTDLASDTAEGVGESVAEGLGLGLAQFIPGADILLDVGALGSLGITAILGLSKGRKENNAEDKYKATIKQEQNIQNQAHTISSIVQPTGEQVQGGVSTAF
jgi:hypothetical protein